MYLIYFRYRERRRRKGLPPKNMIPVLHLLGIPTGHIWLVMPWLPQVRSGSSETVWTMFSSGSNAMMVGMIGVLLALAGGYYCFRFVRTNFAVTMQDYSIPTELLRTGIYGQLRHPGVVAMFFLISGLCLATGALYTLLMLPLLVPMLWMTTYIEESEVLLPRFGDAYREYMDAVSGFWCRQASVGLALFVFAIGLLGFNEYGGIVGRLSHGLGGTVNLSYGKAVSGWMCQL